ncbi:hypothetical protein ILYODFUR_015757 [Ilyodon furcidens]|uniref:Uncharacterized protein n=1 Tax=Ilyodon furcidens TaxID=33524 RepID=A0ABV0TUY7_9TELE
MALSSALKHSEEMTRRRAGGWFTGKDKNQKSKVKPISQLSKSETRRLKKVKILRSPGLGKHQEPQILPSEQLIHALLCSFMFL